jgi:CDP-diacylglycerol pyrophosphatase
MGRAADSRQGVFDRDILWKVVDNCLKDDSSADYCKNCPAPLLSHLASCVDTSGSDPVAICRETTEVWDKTGDFVALRDRKMCGCPADFVHGLALPLRKVTGVEDPAKPAGIWRFAWDEAVKRIGAEEKDAIVIAANPRAQRTQDQLHIHLARLADGARQKFLNLRPVRIKDLSEVWAVAAQHAAAAGLAEDGYGVAVVHDSASDGFLVAASADSPEKLFSVFSCSSRAIITHRP